MCHREIEGVLEELRDAQEQLAENQTLLQQKERLLLEKEAKLGVVNQQVLNTVLVNNVNSHVDSSGMSTNSMKDNLKKLWATLDTSPEEKLAMMISLFDCVQGPVSAENATPTALSPALINKYIEIEAKLTARLPINKLLTHKQLLEFKLKNAQVIMNNAANTVDYEANSKICAMLSQELVDLNALLNVSLTAYQEDHRESYFYSPPGVTINENKNTTHILPSASSPSAGGAPAHALGSTAPAAGTRKFTVSPSSGAGKSNGNSGAMKMSSAPASGAGSSRGMGNAPLSGSRLFSKQ